MSTFPTGILPATEGSADAEPALSTARDIANSTDSQPHPMTAEPDGPDPAYRTQEAGLRCETYEEAAEAVQREAQRVLDERVRKVEEPGAPSRTPTCPWARGATRL